MTDLLSARRPRFNVERYHRMGGVGILPEDDHIGLMDGERRLFTTSGFFLMAEGERVESIEGEILTMNPMDSPPAASAKRLNTLIGAQIRWRSAMVNHHRSG